MYIACRDVIILRGYLDIKERRKQTIMNNIDDLVEIYECPLCGGAGILEEDCGSSYYVTCLECGCHSVNIDFKSDDDRLDAAKRTADLWNCGKVILAGTGMSQCKVQQGSHSMQWVATMHPQR